MTRPRLPDIAAAYGARQPGQDPAGKARTSARVIAGRLNAKATSTPVTVPPALPIPAIGTALPGQMRSRNVRAMPGRTRAVPPF